MKAFGALILQYLFKNSVLFLARKTFCTAAPRGPTQFGITLTAPRISSNLALRFLRFWNQESQLLKIFLYFSGYYWSHDINFNRNHLKNLGITSGFLESSYNSKRFRITSTKILSVGPLGCTALASIQVDTSTIVLFLCCTDKDAVLLHDYHFILLPHCILRCIHRHTVNETKENKVSLNSVTYLYMYHV